MLQRKATRPGEAETPRVEALGSIWRVRSSATARQVLRARDRTTQAGFTAEWIPRGLLRHHPILISDGPLHDEQRSKVGRFFAPTVVDQRYLGHIEDAADRLLADAGDGCRLDELALHYSVEVTAQIVGLTASEVPAMSRRLVSFFRQPPVDLTRPDLGRSHRQWAQAAVNGLVPVLRFYLADVRPAIRERRRRPRSDVISHLIAEGYTDADILVECVTYGTAGMVTTREFISMACWHLLTNPELRQRYATGERSERFAILHELIRLEPVVGHLYRRASADLPLNDQGRQQLIPPGALVDVCVRQANADPEATGAGLSFGDGAHACPGQPLAITETDVLLTRLLAREPRIVREPRLGWDNLIEGYRLRDFELAFDG